MRVIKLTAHHAFIYLSDPLTGRRITRAMAHRRSKSTVSSAKDLSAVYATPEADGPNEVDDALQEVSVGSKRRQSGGSVGSAGSISKRARTSLGSTGIDDAENDVAVATSGGDTNAGDDKNLVGTKVQKSFPGYGTFKGTVTKFRTAVTGERLYFVLYSDGDSEEMTAAEVASFKVRLRRRKSRGRRQLKRNAESSGPALPSPVGETPIASRVSRRRRSRSLRGL